MYNVYTQIMYDLLKLPVNKLYEYKCQSDVSIMDLFVRIFFYYLIIFKSLQAKSSPT